MAELNDRTLRELSRPFAPNALRFKVQATWPKDNPTGGLVVPYVDARTVAARLNHVVGMSWSTRFEPWDKGALCALTIHGVTRQDVGKGGSFEAEKAAVSDALKRAAVQFGVGAYIYALSSVTLDVTENGAMKGKVPTLKKKKSKGGSTAVLTDKAEEWLRATYENWLGTDRNKWGEALDHGDEPDPTGDPVEREPIEQEDLELAAKKAEAQEQYDSMNGEAKILPGRFKPQLTAAKDAGAVDALMAKVRGNE